MRSSVPSQLHRSKYPWMVERGGRSFGMARHWQPVDRIYMRPFTTSRMITVRLSPPRLAGGDQRLNKRPFVIRQIAGIAQEATIITSAVVRRPHGRLLRIRPPPLNHK